MAKPPLKQLHDILSIKPQLKGIDECEMMVEYAQSQGKPIPSHVLKQLGDLQAIKHDIEHDLKDGTLDTVDPRSLNLSLIGSLHRELAAVIAPASPATVLLMQKNKRRGFFGLLGPVPLVRRLNIITMLCLITFLGLFYAPEVDAYTVNQDILTFEGMKFILNELAIVCIAALGASFYALFEVYKYITKNSYDPKYDSIYWIRFVLGIVSGVILAQFIFVSPEVLGQDAGGTVGNINKSQELGGFMTYKPLLAFLGGFSARVVHKILNSMVESIETFISGSARDMVAAREAAAKAQMQDKVNAIKQKNAENEAVERMKATMKLMKIQQDQRNGASAEDINAQLSNMMNDFMKPVGGVDINFNAQNTTPNPTVPVVDNYQPGVVEHFDPNPTITPPPADSYSNDANMVTPPVTHDVAGSDVDEIKVPDFPDDMDNPDFPMPGDIKDDKNFDPNDPNLKV